MTPHHPALAASGPEKILRKYLTFTLSRESYGIDVLQVREIIRLTEITPIPRMPAYVRGVINLRGRIIPVIDLRVRFGFVDVKDTDTTCIIVVQVRFSEDRDTQMGLIVDGVEEVLTIAAADIEETPNFNVKVETDYILGMAKVKSSVKTLINIDRVLAAGQLKEAERTFAG